VLIDTGSFAMVPNSDLQISESLRTATLTTTINVFDDVSNSSFDVFINLTWIGTGEVQRDNVNNSHLPGDPPGITFLQYQITTFREAQAFGSISDGVTNFTLASSDFASLRSVKSGEIRIN